MRIRHLLVPLLFLIPLLTGCANSGAFTSTHRTDVQLSGDNYEIVATDVTGEATAGYVLGISAGGGTQQVGTLALARVTGSDQLYGDALKDLWTRFRAEHGDVQGRQLALTNVRFDGDALNLLLFTRPKITVRADVIAFTDES